MGTNTGANLTAASPSDLALVRAIRAWGEAEDSGEPGVVPHWRCFSPDYRARLNLAWSFTARIGPELAWQTLLRDHLASIQHDPRRVHPSWLLRILEAESPAVRWLLINHAPEPIRSIIGKRWPELISAMRLAWTDQGFSPNPDAVDWALTLWTERLVGDIDESPDDSPLIMALSTFGPRDLYRLTKVAGQIKQVFASYPESASTERDETTVKATVADRVRIGYFRRTIGRPDPRLIPIARADLTSVQSGPRRRYAAVGLITFGRLLKAGDAYRARWAIQHLPYPIAKLVGTLGGRERVDTTVLPIRAIRGWESWILEAAWARLLAEGRLGTANEGKRT